MNKFPKTSYWCCLHDLLYDSDITAVVGNKQEIIRTYKFMQDLKQNIWGAYLEFIVIKCYMKM